MPPAHGDLSNVRVGCAGWSLPRETWPEFPEAGSHLERYAARLNAAEINSSFYRPHQPATYARWAASVPDGFRFSVKLPKTITHEKRLRDCENLLDDFLPQVTSLGEKLGCLLVQLPPSLAFDAAAVRAFFDALRERHAGAIAIEPRHASWFTPAADALLQAAGVGRVLADPVMFDAGRAPGGDPGLVYVRLHGSPRMYYSAYAPAVLDALIVRLKLAAASDASLWCIFDNTASGAAVPDALYLARGLARR
ncbi:MULTISPECIES: DUF72 domain-containing protein [unclassified Polaromonas]|uniref:DUF72 domain-containing protein n=1 Tax=unclassified Polaromonas TaxID=2638319 RepID=UPI000F07A476|nr:MULTISPECIES: DUF72 domain-containing protein [unclassified Polaromonas]AYQ27543.1 DUF72 domain-containing protein [Polaromonas sp. SP1]QGJ17615.1 DUF72 domain-containing protein [Polaromonas sp. Pch-P]